MMEMRLETMKARLETMRDEVGDNGEGLRESLLMDRAVLGARVRWESNLTETERESRSVLPF